MQLWLKLRLRYVVSAAWLVAGCSRPDASKKEAHTGNAPPVGASLFTLMPSSYTGVHFENRVTDTRDQNVFTYRNIYNGGGVATADFTGDGLPEVILTSNADGPRFYLNEGKFQFRDATEEVGLAAKGFWATGITVADVNGDGLLDIYICYAGKTSPEQRANRLYINNGINKSGLPTFTERAAAYGIADQSYSTQAVFFDYDRDGRLDLFLLNNSPRPASSFGLQNTRNVRDKFGGDKLYHNVGDHFVDVSEKAGIYGSEIGLGLGVAE